MSPGSERIEKLEAQLRATADMKAALVDLPRNSENVKMLESLQQQIIRIDARLKAAWAEMNSAV